jgi:DNA helicase-2/ATP-dependent DNA helicase PcrA
MHLPHFQQLLAQAAGRRPNPDQLQAIHAPPTTPLFIVAGPGTGKTATLVLRMLRLVFFDRIPPQNILAVTFTRKAADELRSRLQLWGQRLAQLLPAAPPATSQYSGQPAADPYNLQQLFAGTIDSLCQQLLIRYPGTSAFAPNIADASLSDALLRHALLKDRRDTDPQLHSLLLSLRGSGEGPWNLPAQVRLLRTLLDPPQP